MGTLWTSKACYLTHHPGLTAGPWRELWSLWNSCCWRWWWGSLWGPGCDKWPSDHMWSPLKEPGVRRRRWSDALFVMRKTKKFHNLHEFIWTVKMQRCDWNLTVDISHTSLFNVRILDSCICERLLTWRGMKTQCWDTHDTLSNKVHIADMQIIFGVTVILSTCFLGHVGIVIVVPGSRFVKLQRHSREVFMCIFAFLPIFFFFLIK